MLIAKINENIYDSLSKPISIQEQQVVLKDVKNKSAPGSSGISYPLIRKAGSLAQELFLVLANKCIKEGDILTKWKVGQLYSILKGENWNYNLANVRPIVLLEAFRKVVVRVVGKRLDIVLTKHNILQGPNYTGLSGSSTSSPIHIMNNLIEEAREKNKEIQILFQDIKKAFDSVSLKMLEKVLERIKLPTSTKKFLLNLFNSRRIKVITSFGLTQEFTAEDGLDQGEVVSPLLWYIFYDLLLYKIQNKRKLEYKMSLDQLTNLNYNKFQKMSWKQGVLAYADDTTQIANSKEELTEIIKIANKFYILNDIKINRKKSKLLVINYNQKKESSTNLAIKVEKNNNLIYAKQETEVIRYLGV